ncbi:MAG: GntR family transcriptional regulator [Coriobacteriaceae bacterium]|nr:GntR family transcriptional regulator [Coriobacteriaceae bacterium]
MPLPKYAQIARELRNEITSGKFDYGDRFYSEAELTKRFGVSSITVIHAIKNLVYEGYLVRYQGRGTFISRARKNRLVEFNDIEVFSDHSDEEHVEVLSMHKDSKPEVLKRLGLMPGGEYYLIVRLRKIGDVPYHLQYSAIPTRFIRDDVGPEYYESVYKRFVEDHGIHLYNERSTETDEILYPAPPAVAEKLWPGSDPEAVVAQEKTTWLSSGEVVEYIKSFKKWDYYKIEFSSYQP